jgi:O-antigen/teichoic acid export membrane protein
MFNIIKNNIERIKKNENQLSRKVLKNILHSFGVKVGSVAIGLILIPLTINYVNTVQYGIWLTISSMVSWISFFDIGMGNGMRNKLTTSVTLNDYVSARKYVSTTYAILAGVFFFCFVLFLLINNIINWNYILNIPENINLNMRLIV